MDLILQEYFNSVCCEEIVITLNEFTYSTGTAPSLEDFETAIGFSLINGQKVGDTITFDNVDYELTQDMYEYLSETTLTSVVSSTNLITGTLFNNLEEISKLHFPRLVNVTLNNFNYCGGEYNPDSGLNFPPIDAYFPLLETILNNSFSYSQGWRNQTFPELKSIGVQGSNWGASFRENPHLESPQFPKLENIYGTGNFLENPKLTNPYFPELKSIENNIFYRNPLFVSELPLLETMGNGNFGSGEGTGYVDLVLPSLTSMGNGNFTLGGSFTNGLTSFTANNLLTIGNSNFAYQIELSEFNAPLTSMGNGNFGVNNSLLDMDFSQVNNFGSNTSDNDDDTNFFGISGKTITVKAKSIHQTSNGGNLEGDLQYLADNNTVDFDWV
jgi:hypothetical protein